MNDDIKTIERLLQIKFGDGVSIIDDGSLSLEFAEDFPEERRPDAREAFLKHLFGRSPSKYKAKKVEVDGIVFDSRAEGRRYVELSTLEAANEIKNLEVHPRYAIEVKGKHICYYEADFKYQQRGEWGLETIVEDVKGKRTRDYVLKKKLIKAVHGIEILEITKKFHPHLFRG